MRCSETLLFHLTFLIKLSYQFHLSDFSSWCSLLAYNRCECVADEDSFHLPFSNYLHPHVWAHNLGDAFLESQPDPEETKRHRAEEYSKYQNRWHTHTCAGAHKLCTWALNWMFFMSVIKIVIDHYSTGSKRLFVELNKRERSILSQLFSHTTVQPLPSQDLSWKRHKNLFQNKPIKPFFLKKKGQKLEVV